MNIKLNGEPFFRITEGFGVKDYLHTNATGHTGIDLATLNHTPLPSVSDGIVEKIYRLGDVNVGNGIKIETPDHHEIIYGHLSKIFVEENQHVHIGQIIGETGNSGHSTGFHLHLGEKIGGHFVDPSHYIDVLQQLAHNLLDASWSTVGMIIHMF